MCILPADTSKAVELLKQAANKQVSLHPLRICSMLACVKLNLNKYIVNILLAAKLISVLGFFFFFF